VEESKSRLLSHQGAGFVSTEIHLSEAVVHPDSKSLAAELSKAIASGACRVNASALNRIELGPLQVLLSAARTARASGAKFHFSEPGPDSDFHTFVAAHALQASVAELLPATPTKTN
jgi:ABC-type transporter Mla MlaB component